MYNSLKKITLNHFLESRLHLGHRSIDLHPKMNSFVFGFRHNIVIFDIDKFWLYLRYFFFNLVEIFYKRNSFFLISTNSNMPTKFLINKFSEQYPLKIEGSNTLYMNGFVTEKWIGGILSNWNVIFNFIKYLKLKKKKDRKLSQRHAKYLNYFEGLLLKKPKPVLPDFIVALDSNKNALKEIHSMKIPLLGLVDSNTNPEYFLYQFFGNNDGIESIEFFFEFLKEALCEGRLKEQEFLFYYILTKIKKKL